MAEETPERAGLEAESAGEKGLARMAAARYVVGAMKVTAPLLVFVGFGLASYLVYPTVSGVHAQAGAARAVGSDGGSGAVVLEITREDFPEKVTLKIPVTVYSSDRSTSFELPAGQMVTPVRLEGDLLVVRPGTSPLEGEVVVSATDFHEKVAAIVAARPAVTPVVKAPAAPPAAEETPAAPVVPALEEAVEETPAAVVVEEVVEAPAVVVPAVVVEEVFGESVAGAAGSAMLDEAGLVGLMKASVGSGQVKQFKVGDVSSWEAGANETIDGQEYQTGMAVYQTEGPFGVSTVRAKALVKDGKVVKWIGAKSGLEIK